VYWKSVRSWNLLAHCAFKQLGGVQVLINSEGTGKSCVKLQLFWRCSAQD
jgi:hypothetical protein